MYLEQHSNNGIYFNDAFTKHHHIDRTTLVLLINGILDPTHMFPCTANVELDGTVRVNFDGVDSDQYDFSTETTMEALPLVQFKHWLYTIDAEELTKTVLNGLDTHQLSFTSILSMYSTGNSNLHRRFNNNPFEDVSLVQDRNPFVLALPTTSDISNNASTAILNAIMDRVADHLDEILLWSTRLSKSTQDYKLFFIYSLAKLVQAFPLVISDFIYTLNSISSVAEQIKKSYSKIYKTPDSSPIGDESKYKVIHNSTFLYMYKILFTTHEQIYLMNMFMRVDPKKQLPHLLKDILSTRIKVYDVETKVSNLFLLLLAHDSLTQSIYTIVDQECISFLYSLQKSGFMDSEILLKYLIDCSMDKIESMQQHLLDILVQQSTKSLAPTT